MEDNPSITTYHLIGPAMRNCEMEPFGAIDKCSCENRESQRIACDLYGTLVKSRSSFPYFMLVAFEAGGILRSVLLLLASPFAWLLYHCVSESAGIKLLIFVTFAGLQVTKLLNPHHQLAPTGIRCSVLGQATKQASLLLPLALNRGSRNGRLCV